MLWLRPDTGVRCGVLRPCGVLFFFNIDGNGAVMSAYRLRFSLQWTAAAALAVACGATLAQDVQTVKIGHAGPISGGIAHIGKDTENGVRMAVDDLNTQNLVIGGKKIKFVIAAEDDAGDPRQATAVAQKLCDQKVAGVVGHLQSGTSIPASSIYDKCDLPHITASASNPDLTKPGYKTSFRLIANDNALGAALALFAADALKLKSVAIIDDRTAYGQGLTDQVIAAVKRAGGEIVAREYTTDKATDFTAILTSIKAKGAEAIFFGGLDAQSGPMRRQMQTLGITQPLVSGEMTRSDTFLKLAGEAANGTYASLAGVPLKTMAQGEQFAAAYKARFKVDPGVYAPYAYDGAWNMIAAMEQAGSAKADKYLPKLAGLKRSGATSAHIAYDKNGDLNEVAVTIYTVKGGKWEEVKTIVDSAK